MSNHLQPQGLYSPWDSPGQNIGVGSHSLLQGIFPTQGPNLGLLHHRQILYQLSQQGNSRILEWVAYPSSSRSSQPRNWTGVSCIATRFFTSWPTSSNIASILYRVRHSWATELNWCIYINSNLPVHPTLPSPMVSVCLFSLLRLCFFIGFDIHELLWVTVLPTPPVASPSQIKVVDWMVSRREGRIFGL